MHAEPYWLPLPIIFPAPAGLGTRLTFNTEKLDFDALILGVTSDLFDPYATDTAARAVPRLLAELQVIGPDISFTRRPVPLWAFSGNLYQLPLVWPEPFKLPRQTTLELKLQIDRSPTIAASAPQDITGHFVFHCRRLN